MGPTRLFLHPEDRSCILFHLVLGVAWTLAFVVWRVFQPGWSTGETAAFIAAASLVLGWCAGIDVAVNYHNHAHRPFFRSPTLNRWVGRLWTVTSGWPSYFFDHSHIRVHHSHLLTDRDWTLARRGPDGRQASLPWYAVTHWPWRFAREFWADFVWRDPDPEVRRRGRVELLVFLALWCLPFLWDPWMALWVWLVPQYVGNVLLSGSGMYAQHAGCVAPDAAHPHEHSNSTDSALHNATMFNLGYHALHHERPDVHWTALPRLHTTLLARDPGRAQRVFGIGYYAIASALAGLPSGRDTREARIAGWMAGENRVFDRGFPATRAVSPAYRAPWRLRAEAWAARAAERPWLRYTLRCTFPLMALTVVGAGVVSPLLSLTLALAAYQASKEIF